MVSKTINLKRNTVYVANFNQDSLWVVAFSSMKPVTSSLESWTDIWKSQYKLSTPSGIYGSVSLESFMSNLLQLHQISVRDFKNDYFLHECKHLFADFSNKIGRWSFRIQLNPFVCNASSLYNLLKWCFTVQKNDLILCSALNVLQMIRMNIKSVWSWQHVNRQCRRGGSALINL